MAWFDELRSRRVVFKSALPGWECQRRLEAITFGGWMVMGRRGDPPLLAGTVRPGWVDVTAGWEAQWLNRREGMSYRLRGRLYEAEGATWLDATVGPPQPSTAILSVGSAVMSLLGIGGVASFAVAGAEAGPALIWGLGASCAAPFMLHMVTRAARLSRAELDRVVADAMEAESWGVAPT